MGFGQGLCCCLRRPFVADIISYLASWRWRRGFVLFVTWRHVYGFILRGCLGRSGARSHAVRSSFFLTSETFISWHVSLGRRSSSKVFQLSSGLTVDHAGSSAMGCCASRTNVVSMCIETSSLCSVFCWHCLPDGDFWVDEMKISTPTMHAYITPLPKHEDLCAAVLEFGNNVIRN